MVNLRNVGFLLTLLALQVFILKYFVLNRYDRVTVPIRSVSGNNWEVVIEEQNQNISVVTRGEIIILKGSALYEGVKDAFE